MSERKKKVFPFLTFDHLTTPIQGLTGFLFNPHSLKSLKHHHIFALTISFFFPFFWAQIHSFPSPNTFTGTLTFFIDLIWVLPHSNWRHSASAHDFASSAWWSQSAAVELRQDDAKKQRLWCVSHQGDNKPSFLNEEEEVIVFLRWQYKPHRMTYAFKT